MSPTRRQNVKIVADEHFSFFAVLRFQSVYKLQFGIFYYSNNIDNWYNFGICGLFTVCSISANMCNFLPFGLFM